MDGDDRRWRMWREAQLQAYVLAVSGQEYVWLDGHQRQVKTVWAALPAEGWTRLRAGEGTKGPRWDDWRWLALADPIELDWRRWLLVRRSVSDPTDLTASVVLAPEDTTLAEVGRIAGTRWTIESGFEAAKSEVGLDHDEVRRWTGWYRHITLALWALALLTGLRAGAIAVDMFKKHLPLPQEESRLAAFKAWRGLGSHGACQRFAASSGAWSWRGHIRPSTSWPGQHVGAGIRASPSTITISVAGHWRHNHLVTTVVLGRSHPRAPHPTSNQR